MDDLKSVCLHAYCVWHNKHELWAKEIQEATDAPDDINVVHVFSLNASGNVSVCCVSS